MDIKFCHNDYDITHPTILNKHNWHQNWFAMKKKQVRKAAAEVAANPGRILSGSRKGRYL
jgi:hypothetical protein